MLEHVAVFDEQHRLTRLRPVAVGELESQENSTALKVLEEGPLPVIHEASVRTIKAETGTVNRLLVTRDVTSKQEQHVHAQEQDRLAAMGQLATGIAHDFNNLLTTMIGYTDILALTPSTPDEHREKMKIISSQDRRAEQLVRQVLSFSFQGHLLADHPSIRRAYSL